MGLRVQVISVFFILFSLVALASITNVSAVTQPFDSIPINEAYLPFRLEMHCTIPSSNASIHVIPVSNVSETTLWGSSAVSNWMTTNATDLYHVDAWFAYTTPESPIIAYTVTEAGVLVETHSYNFAANGISLSVFLFHFDITTMIKPQYPTTDQIAEATSEKAIEKIGVYLDGLRAQQKTQNDLVNTNMNTMSQWTIIAVAVAVGAIFGVFYLFTRATGVSSQYIELERRVRALEPSRVVRTATRPAVQVQPQAAQKVIAPKPERTSDLEKIKKFVMPQRKKEANK